VSSCRSSSVALNQLPRRQFEESGDKATAESVRRAAEWTVWHADWHSIAGTPAPSLARYRELLEGGPDWFPSIEVTEEALVDTHAWWAMDYAAAHLYRTGKQLPPPPSFRPKAEEGSR